MTRMNTIIKGTVHIIITESYLLQFSGPTKTLSGKLFVSRRVY